jgi:hypothetical protein
MAEAVLGLLRTAPSQLPANYIFSKSECDSTYIFADAMIHRFSTFPTHFSFPLLSACRGSSSLALACFYLSPDLLLGIIDYRV